MLERVAAMLPAEQQLQLEMELNGAATGLVGAFRQDAEGRLWAVARDLEQAGLQTRWLAVDEAGMVRLDRVPGLAFQYDEASQTIRFTAAPNALLPTQVDAGRRSAPGPQTPPSTAAVLNYSVYASVGGGKGTDGVRFEGVSGAFEARVSGRLGAVSHGFVARASAGLETTAVRLDTTWSYDDPRRMLAYRAGDLVTGGPAWGRPVRLGGVQVARRFALRPDLVTMPLPLIGGTAQAPSSLDLYINQVKALSTKVPAGPFEVARPPVVHGAGTAAVVLRDALGRETVMSLPFYASPQLLAPGLADFSAEAGFARRAFGGSSWGYDRRLAGSGAVRYGLSPNVTLEGRAEITSRLRLLGAGAVMGVGRYGVASASMAVSQAGGRTGALIDWTVEARHAGFSFSAGQQRANRDFHDLASWTAEPLRDDPLGRALFQPARAVNRAQISAPLALEGAQVGLSYTEVQEANGRVGALGLSLNQSRRTWSSYLSATRDLHRRGDYRIQAGLTVPLRREVTASVAVHGGSGPTTVAVEASGDADLGADRVSWRAATIEGKTAHRSLQASYATGFGRFDGRLFQSGGKAGVSADAAGSLVLIDRKPFFSRRVEGAFALVDVGAPGVTVRHENRPIGRTGRRGLVLLPELVAFHPNRIEVEPDGLAIDTALETSEAVVTPFDRTGAIVRLKARASTNAALVSFTLPGGAPVPVGSSGRLAGAEESFIIGYDGEAYVEGLGPRNQVEIELAEGGTCSASFTFSPSPGRQARVQEAVCRSLQYVQGGP